MENPFEEKTTQRPTLLIVLCILTFVGSGWSILSGLFSLFTAGLMDSGGVYMNQYSSMVGEMENQGMSSFLTGFMESSMDVLQVKALHAKEIASLQLVLGLISLIGAILMFQLRRVGFFLYAAAQVVELFILPYFAGFALVVLAGMFFSSIFTILFIVLYALNLKYMNR